MAMLAEPRRKQKVINLRAKNNAWSNDSNKFGQRMLEKMGWSAGKGLGANENGIVEHVVARYKNDEKGLGFEDRNDQWTKHEDDFNSLLANLSNGEKKDDKLHSGVSLEVKSKKSKARVHYHKFTRGKDLTRYSEKDLANIFGKKTLKNVEVVVETAKDVKSTDQVFTDKGSMVDYFKSKLASFKSNNYSTNANESADCGFKRFSGTEHDDGDTDNHQGFGFEGFSFHVPKTDDTLDGNVESIKKSKKKKKKHKNLDEETKQLENVQNNECENEICSEIVTEKVKKSKKKKSRDPEESLSTQIVKRSEKNETENVEEHTVEDYVPKKKKKRKNKDIINE